VIDDSLAGEGENVIYRAYILLHCSVQSASLQTLLIILQIDQWNNLDDEIALTGWGPPNPDNHQTWTAPKIPDFSFFF
jgi:hypothetical protein